MKCDFKVLQFFLISRVNFVFTEEHKKRRLDVVDLSEHEKGELEEYYQNGEKTKTEVVDYFKQKWSHTDEQTILEFIEKLTETSTELPILLSNNSYSFTDAHKDEMVNYYNQERAINLRNCSSF